MRRALAIVAVTMTLLLPGASAQAGAPPDSAEIAALQTACDDAPLVRLTTKQSVFEVRRPRVSADGFTIPAPTAPQALITIGDAGPHAQTIPWADVLRLESEHSRILPYTAVGFACGLGLTWLCFGDGGPQLAGPVNYGELAYGAPITIACTATGMLLGMLNPKLRRLYP